MPARYAADPRGEHRLVAGLGQRPCTQIPTSFHIAAALVRNALGCPPLPYHAGSRSPGQSTAPPGCSIPSSLQLWLASPGSRDNRRLRKISRAILGSNPEALLSRYWCLAPGHTGGARLIYPSMTLGVLRSPGWATLCWQWGGPSTMYSVSPAQLAKATTRPTSWTARMASVRAATAQTVINEAMEVRLVRTGTSPGTRSSPEQTRADGRWSGRTRCSCRRAGPSTPCGARE